MFFCKTKTYNRITGFIQYKQRKPPLHNMEEAISIVYNVVRERGNESSSYELGKTIPSIFYRIFTPVFKSFFVSIYLSVPRFNIVIFNKYTFFTDIAFEYVN